MTNFRAGEKEKSVWGIICRHDINHTDPEAKKILHKMWNMGYNLGQIEIVKEYYMLDVIDDYQNSNYKKLREILSKYL